MRSSRRSRDEAGDAPGEPPRRDLRLPPLAEFSFLFSPVRHAANNLAMVLLMNLESAARVIPPTERGSRQIARALEAAEEYDRLMRSLLALTRSEQEVPLRASAYLQDLLPLLGLAAGRKLTLEAEGEPAELRVRRPALDAALLALMQDMPAGSPPCCACAAPGSRPASRSMRRGRMRCGRPE